MRPVWVETSYRLEYMLGEFPLTRLDLGALQPDRFFLDLPDDPGELVDLAPTRGPVVIPSLPVRHPLSRLAIRGGRIRYLVYRFPRHLLRFHETFDEYMKSLGSNTRYAVRKAIRKVRKQGEGACRLEEYRSPREVVPFLEAAGDISSRTYQTRVLKAGVSDDPATRRELEQRAEAGEFRSFILWLGDRPISYMLGTTRGRIYRQDHIGFDPAYYDLGPGRALHGLAVERLHDSQDYDLFDFTPGGGAHKERHSTDRVECVDLVYLPFGPRGVILVASHLLLQGVSRGAVRVMDALGLKERIKKLVRGLGEEQRLTPT
ncbi:MAG: GNAT family N-acetyltransferase [Gemmatimonadetes bacterium]|nr:GNAT family N-acetyltransferase [Gemmatimonadota bacterium]